MDLRSYLWHLHEASPEQRDALNFCPLLIYIILFSVPGNRDLPSVAFSIVSQPLPIDRIKSKNSDHAAGPNYQGSENIILLIENFRPNLKFCHNKVVKRKEITHARTRILSLIKLRITPSSYYKHLRKLKRFTRHGVIIAIVKFVGLLPCPGIIGSKKAVYREKQSKP
uniref:Uncharacterized protein n=1 Tax=Glossina austeni TaxID=7395 RepID=A0A1A9V9W9_GLOAU